MEPATSQGPGTGGTPQSPVTHLIIFILQNHSFDSLFATYPGVADPLAPTSAGYTQPGATGGTITPYLLTDSSPPDMPHGYTFTSAALMAG